MSVHLLRLRAKQTKRGEQEVAARNMQTCGTLFCQATLVRFTHHGLASGAAFLLRVRCLVKGGLPQEAIAAVQARHKAGNEAKRDIFRDRPPQGLRTGWPDPDGVKFAQ